MSCVSVPLAMTASYVSPLLPLFGTTFGFQLVGLLQFRVPPL
jgi:hypothetical protein